MTSRERVLAALSDEAVPDRVPWVEQVVHADALGRMLGRSLSDPIRHIPIDPDAVFAHFAATADCLHDLGIDGLGCPCWTPVIVDPLVVDGKTVSNACQPGIVDWATFEKRTREMPRPKDMPFARYVEPWFRAMDRHGLFRALLVGMQYRMLEVSIGFENMGIWHVEQPALLQAAAKFFCDWTSEAIAMVLERCPFDALWVDDDIAFNTGTFVSPAWLREYTFPYHRRFVELARSYGLPTLYHSDGDLSGVIDDLMAAGFVSIHPLERQAIDIRAVRRRVGDRITLMGNVDIDLLERGEPQACYEQAAALIRDLGPRRFVLASGNCITQNARVDNVKAVSRAVREQEPVAGHRGGAR